MKFYNRFISLSILCFTGCLIITNFAVADMRELAAVQGAIKERGALWIAGESWVTRLSAEERQKLLGEHTMDVEFVEPRIEAIGSDYPAAIDWRSKDGPNWVTPIRNQKTCGSCGAFGAVATLESLIRIEKSQPQANINLSEMHLFNCGGSLGCDFGWYNSLACSYLGTDGTPHEACWPYEPFDRPCDNTCSNWEKYASKIESYGRISSGIEALKAHVAIAPVLAAFIVYDDFYHYQAGIYEHTWGGARSGHAICIVGYDTTGPVPYWIVKNSWGSDWGERGYFRIKMGECNIETGGAYWMSGATYENVGDVNGDGSVNVVDILIVVNVILERPGFTVEAYPKVDVNEDGVVNVIDLQSIINILLLS